MRRQIAIAAYHLRSLRCRVIGHHITIRNPKARHCSRCRSIWLTIDADVDRARKALRAEED